MILFLSGIHCGMVNLESVKFLTLWFKTKTFCIDVCVWLFKADMQLSAANLSLFQWSNF